MFKKIVTNLPFSPALIGQLGFYARRLKQEEATRKLGLLFTALAVVVQSFAVFSPPEAQAVASNQNIIYQGVRDKADLLRVYDANIDNFGHRDIQAIYSYFGVTRADIARAKEGTFNSRDFNLGIWSVGRNSYDAGRPEEQAHKIPNHSTVYARKLWRFDKLPYTQQNGSTYRGVIGERADGSWFAISFDCGNIAFVQFPPPPPKPTAACSSLTVTQVTRTKYRFNTAAALKNGATATRYDFTVIDQTGKVTASKQISSTAATAQTEIDISKDGPYTAKLTVQTSLGPQTGTGCEKPFTVSPEPRCPLYPGLVISDPECKPCPSDSSIWYKDEACKPDYEASKRVSNITQNLDDANGTTAKPGERMQYTLSVKNIGKDTGEYSMKENLGDVLEYADVIETDDGTVEKNDAGDTTGFISWPAERITPGATLSKTIVVQVKDVVPAAPQNMGNPESYNCVMTNSFGTATNVNVECPPPKLVENTVKQLPSTGPGENMLFAGILIMVVTYFYARSRQLKKEVRLVRHEFATGTL